MPKLLYIVHSLNIGGTEILVAELAKAFAKDYQVKVLALDALGQIAEELPKDRVAVECINRQPGWKLANFRKIQKVIAEFQPDLIHAHQYSPFFYAAVAKILMFSKAKLIFTEHGRHYPDLVSAKRRLVNKLLWKVTTAVTAVCQFSAEALRQHEGYQGKVDVIYNGIPNLATTTTIDLRSKYSLPQDSILAVYLGTLRAVKNPQLLVESMREVVRMNNKIYLFIIGGGELLGQVTELVKNANLTNNVILFGSTRSMLEYWENFDLFIQPSLSEAHSLALLEAMSYGIAPIVTKVGGAAEVIENGYNGVLVSSQDSQQLAQAILTLATDSKLRLQLGSNAKQDFEAKYRAAIMIANYQDLYHRLGV